jgi:hypothetical protein
MMKIPAMIQRKSVSGEIFPEEDAAAMNPTS